MVVAEARQLTFIDFFAGIGGFRRGFELAGMKCVGFCEKDKFAVRSYRTMYDTEGEWHGDDITKLRAEDIPQADIWAAGSPCQNLSVAGGRSGLHGERSGLFFDFARLLKGKAEEDKPEWVVLENVKGLLSSNAGWDFLEYICELAEAGYDVRWQIFNSKDYGVPQNRERVYTVGHLGSRGRREILSFGRESGGGLKQIIGGMQGYRVYDPAGLSVALASQAGGIGAKTGLYFINQPVYQSYEASDCCQTIRACGDIVQVMALPARDDSAGKRNSTYRIRRLTPKECFRLQGFSDELFEKARMVNSDAQLYKQAGNAVTVTVAFEVARALLAASLAETREV